jgi:hypothetical protein
MDISHVWGPQYIHTQYVHDISTINTAANQRPPSAYIVGILCPYLPFSTARLRACGDLESAVVTAGRHDHTPLT